MPVRFSRFLATAAVDVWSLFPSLVMRMCWLTSFLIFTMYKALFYCQHVIPWPANKTDRTTATINSLQPFSFIHIYTYVRHGECVWRWNFFHDLLPILFVHNSFLAFVHSLFIQTHILTIYISPPSNCRVCSLAFDLPTSSLHYAFTVTTYFVWNTILVSFSF